MNKIDHKLKIVLIVEILVCLTCMVTLLVMSSFGGSDVVVELLGWIVRVLFFCTVLTAVRGFSAQLQFGKHKKYAKPLLYVSAILFCLLVSVPGYLSNGQASLFSFSTILIIVNYALCIAVIWFIAGKREAK